MLLLRPKIAKARRDKACMNLYEIPSDSYLRTLRAQAENRQTPCLQERRQLFTTTENRSLLQFNENRLLLQLNENRFTYINAENRQAVAY